MIPEKAFERVLGLDECWEVAAAEYETEPSERFLLVIHETQKLWPKLRCPDATCGHREVVCHDHTDARVWRHLDAFGKRTEILCSPPRARCGACRPRLACAGALGGGRQTFHARLRGVCPDAAARDADRRGPATFWAKTTLGSGACSSNMWTRPAPLWTSPNWCIWESMR